jgi:TM2 domain-containing membrane protein YozV
MYDSMAMKSRLEARELLLLESEVKSRGKNMLVAYLLWYFLGIFGGHRFYMGRTGSAVAQLILTITVIGAIVSGIWVIVDAFLLYQWVRERNAQVEQEVLTSIINNRAYPM